jgi:hypothetical protein
MSMILFTLILNSQLFMLDRHPEGIQCGNGTQGISWVIHDDDSTLFLIYEQVS